MEAAKKIPVKQDLYSFEREDMRDLKLLGSFCTSCGEKHFPQKSICPHCSSQELEQFFLSDQGAIETYTVVRQTPPNWQGSVPYIIVAVRLDDGVGVTSHLVECDPQEVKIGARVKVVAAKLRDGEDGSEIMVHMFKPID